MTAEDQTEAVFDKVTLEADIIAGAREYSKLLHHAAHDWASWEIIIIGLRALRDLAFAKAHTSDIHSYAYRQEMSALLQLKKYSVYDQIDKPTRSACYKLMDSLEELSVWYAAQSPADKLRWKHPQSIMKHAPSNLVRRQRRQQKEAGKIGVFARSRAAQDAADSGNQTTDQIRTGSRRIARPDQPIRA
jgi:hypothetical protein